MCVEGHLDNTHYEKRVYIAPIYYSPYLMSSVNIDRYKVYCFVLGFHVLALRQAMKESLVTSVNQGHYLYHVSGL